MNYTDSDLVGAHLKRSLSNNEELSLSVLIPAIQKVFDKYCHTTFLEAAETSRYYDGGCKQLDIEPCTEITEVMAVNDDATDSYEYTEGTEYLAYPLNQNVKTSIEKRGAYFPEGERRIKVTAKFSSYDGGIPQDIQWAATKVAADVIGGLSTAASQGVASESLEGHSVQYTNLSTLVDNAVMNDPTVIAILEGYKDIALG